MLQKGLRRAGVLALLATVLIFLPACAKKEKPLELVKGQTVRGKVTYKGRPVPYGVVLFYSYEKSIDPQTGRLCPSGIGEINSDGTYEVVDAALGVAMVCVATDPDADIGSLTLPAAMLGIDPGSPPRVGPPWPPGRPPIGPPGGPLPGPPVGAPGPPIDPPINPPGVPSQGPVGGPPGGPPLKPPNPAAERLSADEKKTLKEIHAKYGIVGKSPLGYHVREGEQTFDIKLN
jgi:hypothetical protein